MENYNLRNEVAPKETAQYEILLLFIPVVRLKNNNK